VREINQNNFSNVKIIDDFGNIVKGYADGINGDYNKNNKIKHNEYNCNCNIF
jgi:hypothetical protein